MSFQNITPTSSFLCCSMISSVDSEEKEIMQRLLSYGCTPTGDKTTDRARLRRIEEEKAKQDNYVSNKYLTVSQAECQKIQDKKRENRKINSPDKTHDFQEKRVGAKLLGEQVFLAVCMKNNKIKNDDREDKAVA